jgi:hypothetical protein
MTRFLYRCLIGLHPRAFRERFGDEMLCVFDEAAGTSGMFLADGVGSLARQRILRSGLWRWSVGATLTALLIVSYAHSEAKFERKLMASQQLIEAKRTSPLNQAEFNREAAQAVAMLARFRAADKKKSHPLHSRDSAASDEISQD